MISLLIKVNFFILLFFIASCGNVAKGQVAEGKQYRSGYFYN